jgi:hypothetical protein
MENGAWELGLGESLCLGVLVAKKDGAQIILRDPLQNHEMVCHHPGLCQTDQRPED